MIELGERLTRVASFVPNGWKVCDVGSDHAYLPSVFNSKQPDYFSDCRRSG